MDDAKWLFKTDSKEKKNIAHSARKKVRHTGCKLPSDYLTSKQKKALNGGVKSMNIHKPMTYKYFKTLPKDLQEEFLDYVVSTFHVTAEILCKEMFNITGHGLRNYIRTKNLKSPWTRGQTQPQFDRERWEKFLAGEEVEEPQNAPESCENDLCETNGSSEGMDIPVENASESDEKAHSETKEDEFELVKGEIRFLKALNDAVTNDFNTLKDRYAKLRAENEKLKNRLNAIPVMTLDEIVMEQPFEVGSLSFNLKNIRDWDAIQKCLSAFPLPAYNSVVITVHALREE